MTRSCYHKTRGYCLCEFCIAAQLKNAYVQASNPPKKPINFKKFKKSTLLSPIEIYRNQFNRPNLPNSSRIGPLNQQQNRASTITPLNSPNQINGEINLNANENQSMFLRILSDRLTKLAKQQAVYILGSPPLDAHDDLSGQLLNSLSLLQKKQAMLLNSLKLNWRTVRLRSSISESSSETYQTPDNNETKQSTSTNNSTTNNITHCSSAGMLINTTGLSISNNERTTRIKFGPEDILATTNAMFLFSSNEVNNATIGLIKKSSKRQRKSSNKKESNPQSNVSNHLSSESSNHETLNNEIKDGSSNDKVSNDKKPTDEIQNEDSESQSIKSTSENKGALSNVTNTLQNTNSSSR